MDRKSLIGIVLIGLLVAVWVFIQSMISTRDVTPAATEQKQEKRDSIATAIVNDVATPITNTTSEKLITIVTDKLFVRLSSYGGTIRSWQLNDYQPWYKDSLPKARVDLVHPGSHEFGFTFRQTDGSKINAKDINFDWMVSNSVVTVKGNDSVIVTHGSSKAQLRSDDVLDGL